MVWTFIILFLIAMFLIYCLCKVSSDSDDRMGIMWEEYLQKLKNMENELEDKSKIETNEKS